MDKNAEVYATLLAAMNYRDPSICCDKCGFFIEDDCSGSPNAEKAHCILNPAIDIPVDRRASCKFFAGK